ETRLPGEMRDTRRGRRIRCTRVQGRGIAAGEQISGRARAAFVSRVLDDGRRTTDHGRRTEWWLVSGSVGQWVSRSVGPWSVVRGRATGVAVVSGRATGVAVVSGRATGVASRQSSLVRRA